MAELTAEPAGSLHWSDDLPDVLFALCGLLGKPSEPNLQSQAISSAAYRAVAQVDWPSQVIDERSAILASLAYEAWRISWKNGHFADMRFYEVRCESHVLEQEHARDFLALPPGGRSRVLNARYLSDPAVLLAATLMLRRVTNADPSRAVLHGCELFDWLGEAGETGSSDESAWIACHVALVIGGSLRHLGQISEAESWLDRADAAAIRTSCAELRLQVEYQRLTNMFVRRQLNTVRDRSAKLIEDLERLGLESELGKAMFLHASALKDGGSAAALAAFESLLTKPGVMRDALLCGLSLMHIGDLRGSLGDFEAASDCFREALPLLEESGVPWALADFDAVVAEKFRDAGCLPAAIDRYRSAIKKYSDGGFSVRESYLRLLLSETLIADGQQAEAAAELVAALPAIERESLQQEGIAATALLREVLKRSRTDRESFSSLRAQLDRPRKGDV